MADSALLSPASPLSPSIASSQLFPLDINADGRSDLISVQTSNQKPFEIQTWISDGDDLYQSGDLTMPGIQRSGTLLPCDVNGDGRSDLLYVISYGNSPLKAYYFKSDGHTLAIADTFVAPSGMPTAGSLTMVLDVNGDSRSDLISYKKPNYADKQITMNVFSTITG